jgi:hypothetical protein
MQFVDQTGSMAESAFRLFRLLVNFLIFVAAVAVARWGIRTFFLNRSRRSERWRNSFAVVNVVILILFLLLRSPADKLLTLLGDAIARFRPESELGWLSGFLVGIYYVLIASFLLLVAIYVLGQVYWFADRRIDAWQARLRASVKAGESNPRFHASRVGRFCIRLLRDLVVNLSGCERRPCGSPRAIFARRSARTA